MLRKVKTSIEYMYSCESSLYIVCSKIVTYLIFLSLYDCSTYSSLLLLPERVLDLNVEGEGGDVGEGIRAAAALRFSDSLAKRSRREFSVPGRAVLGGRVVVVVVAAVGKVMGREKAEVRGRVDGLFSSLIASSSSSMLSSSLKHNKRMHAIDANVTRGGEKGERENKYTNKSTLFKRNIYF